MESFKRDNMRKKLPIGIQSLQEIREGNFYYVDKSGFALQLIDQGKYYFPRDHGVSARVCFWTL